MPPKKKDNSNKPWVGNYPPLQQWLDKHDARCLWQIPSSPPDDGDIDWAPQFYVEAWSIGRRIFILTVYSNKMGWYLFTDCDSPRIDESLADAEQRLGIGDSSDVKSQALHLAEVALTRPPIITPGEVETLAKLTKRILTGIKS